MQPENYRLNLIKAVKNLVTVNESIYQSILDVTMQGDLKEFNDSVPVGEVHQFDFEIFRNSSDTNIQLLVNLMDKVEETYQTLININAIPVGEQGQVKCEGLLYINRIFLLS